MFGDFLGSTGGFVAIIGLAFFYSKSIDYINQKIGNAGEKFSGGKFLLISFFAFLVYVATVYIFITNKAFLACLIPALLAVAASMARLGTKRIEQRDIAAKSIEEENNFLQDHAKFKQSKDVSVVRKFESAASATPGVLAELNKTDKNGVLVAFSAKNLGKKEFDNEVEYQSSIIENKEFYKLGWRSSVEDRSIVIGVPGSGKTTYLIAQLVDWMSSGKSFVATDIKPEIWSILRENGVFERFGYTDYVVNPTCKNSHKFNMFSEIENDADLNEVLSVIIAAGVGDSAVFNDNARRLLKAILSHLDSRASLPAARDFIAECGSTDDLLEVLLSSEKKSVQRIAREIKSTAGNDRLLASILTTMNKAFEFLDDETISESISDSDFNMKEVLKKEKVAIFLQFEQKYKNSVATLFGATVAYVLRVLQSNVGERNSPVFVALDEIINAAPIPKFSEFLNTIRSCQMPLAMYLQSIEGLNKLYGVGSDALFIGSSDLKVVFRVNDNPTAGFVSIQGGETIEHTQSTSGSENAIPYILRGEDKSGGTFSKSDNYRRTPLIDSHDVLSLPPGVAIVLYRGKVGQLKMPSYHQDFPMPNRASNNPRPAPSELLTTTNV